MELLFEVNRADTSAKNPANMDEKYEILSEAKRLYKEMLEEGSCVSLEDLDISGKDLIEHGYKQGKAMGELLNKLLNAVINDPKLNDKEILLNLASEFSNKKSSHDSLEKQ